MGRGGPPCARRCTNTTFAGCPDLLAISSDNNLGRNLPDPPDYARTWPFLSNYLLQGEKKQLGVQLSIHVKEPGPPRFPPTPGRLTPAAAGVARAPGERVQQKSSA